MTTGAKRAFPSPFAVETPAGAEGWERMYPYYALSARSAGSSRTASSGSSTGCTTPSRIYPFDTIMTENWWVAVNQ